MKGLALSITMNNLLEDYLENETRIKAASSLDFSPISPRQLLEQAAETHSN